MADTSEPSAPTALLIQPEADSLHVPGVVAPQKASAPLAPERIWPTRQLDGGSEAHHPFRAFSVRGPLEIGALEEALGEMVRRHGMPRTIFHEMDGAPVPGGAPSGGRTLPVQDLSAMDPEEREAELSRRVAEEAARPFDLSAGLLFRASLLRLGEEEHVLLLGMHQAAGGGYGMESLFRELSTLYPAFRKDGEPPLPDACLVEGTVLRGVESLRVRDPVLYDLIVREHRRQMETLTMVAASSIADPAVLVCEGTVLLNTTTEGYPGARFHAGCSVVDQIERIAIERARRAFGASYANVQPHSGTSANQIVMFGLLRPGDTVLGMDLDAGGHLSHGSRASVSGVYFDAAAYGVDVCGRIDMEEVRRLALAHRPRLIVAGASAYPRAIDFRAFREVADEVGAYLLADISHVAGLVAAGEHPSPIEHAHFTTTSTYKQLFGPRGGLVLMGRDHDAPAPDGRGTLSDLVQRAAFPFFQGTPNLAAVAAKASALARVASPEFRETARRIKDAARALAVALHERGYSLVSGGTDNHIVLVDVSTRGLTGMVAERALEECRIVVNKNRVPGDRRSALVTSGIRFGTNGLALRGMGPAEMPRCAELVDAVLSAVRPLGEREYELVPRVAASVREEVAALCVRFPIPGYSADPAPGFPGAGYAA